MRTKLFTQSLGELTLFSAVGGGFGYGCGLLIAPQVFPIAGMINGASIGLIVGIQNLVPFLSIAKLREELEKNPDQPKKEALLILSTMITLIASTTLSYLICLSLSLPLSFFHCLSFPFFMGFTITIILSPILIALKVAELSHDLYFKWAGKTHETLSS